MGCRFLDDRDDDDEHDDDDDDDGDPAVDADTDADDDNAYGDRTVRYSLPHVCSQRAHH